MSRWFRHYAGMARDDKLVRVAIRSKQTLERVVWVWVAILESAAERDDDGLFEFDADEMAYFLRCDAADIQAVFDGLTALGRIEDGRISKWERRQFKADSSTERVKRYRERRAASGLVAQWQPSKALREMVYQRDGHSCVYCGANDDLTIDHKTPEIRGGSHDDSNLQTACRVCNARKRDLTHEEFVSRNTVTVSETRQKTELETEEKKPKAKALVKKRSPIPEDWQPREFAIGSESRKVVDNWPPGEEPAQIEQFIAHHRSKRNTFIDPQDAWSTWVLNTRKWGIGKHERSQQASLSNVVHRILSNGGTDGRAGEDAGPGIANIDERGATRALAARSG